MSKSTSLQSSRAVYVPSAVSSFFEICDRNPDGTAIRDTLRTGSRGGGFVIKRGSITRASRRDSPTDLVLINKRAAPDARTSQKVVDLMRKKFGFSHVKLSHKIEPPIGSGFGTSGSGALGAAIALSDLFRLKLSLAQISAFAHSAEVESMTGLGTVISLASGSGAVGLVTEPGSYSFGIVDAIPVKPSDFTLVCGCFGPIEKSSVLGNESKRRKINKFGRMTLEAVLDEPTPSALLKYSRKFAETTGIASRDLLLLSDRAVKLGAIGATQNMIGNAVHCLVRKPESKRFLNSFQKFVGPDSIFVSELIQAGPTFL